jgi:hypothetical protein
VVFHTSYATVIPAGTQRSAKELKISQSPRCHLCVIAGRRGVPPSAPAQRQAVDILFQGSSVTTALGCVAAGQPARKMTLLHVNTHVPPSKDPTFTQEYAPMRTSVLPSPHHTAPMRDKQNASYNLGHIACCTVGSRKVHAAGTPAKHKKCPHITSSLLIGT